MNGTFTQQTLLLALLTAAVAAAVIYFLVRLIRALESRRNDWKVNCGRGGSGTGEPSDRPGRQIENGGRSD